ncbi:DRP4C, partial [Symbiodinium sp. CCMP2456]
VGAEPLHRTTAEVSKKLGLMESVRHVCQAVQIPLPGVVVVGEQSAGKSSLLENISGIQFPRAQNTCTRMPCILTMLTDPTVNESFALVSMDSSFTDAKRCAVADVEGQIKELTDQHATGAAFISRQALYIRVVRRDGPQLSLIGVTHNAEKMSNIHEVTVSLVKEYIEPEEMVILCVIPAMSDFGNAEVVKLAREYDPEGIRTLGVVTKCDDAANAEASDIVEKVTMSRDSDVRLAFGFHCVVNRSQKNIDEGMSREDLWQKEEKIFTTSDRLRKLPASNWGTLRLMEKVAKIQAEAEGDQFKLFNSTVRLIKDDLQRRVRAEFMSSDEADSALTIAPQATFVQGYTVENLIGPQVFINLIRRIFIEEGLLKDSVNELVASVAEHLRHVVQHVVALHAKVHPVLSSRLASTAEDAIDEMTSKARSLCESLAEAQAVTSTTNGNYMVQLSKFRRSWFQEAADGLKSIAEALLGTAGAKEEEPQLTPEFVELVKQAQEEPDKLAVLELCASLHVYTGFLIEGFVEHAAKLLKFNMVEHLGETLEDTWREVLGGSALHELFPKDEGTARRRKALMDSIGALQDFKACGRLNFGPKHAGKWDGSYEQLTLSSRTLVGFCSLLLTSSGPQEQLSTLKVAAPVPTLVPAKRKTMSDSLQDREKARKEELAARTFVWNFAAELEGKEEKKGTSLDSPKFTKLKVPDMYLCFYPYGDGATADDKSALFLYAPAGWTLTFRLRAGGVEYVAEGWKFDATGTGYGNTIFPAATAFSTPEVSVELLKVPLLLHFDVNKTVIQSDSVQMKGVEEGIREGIADLFWGNVSKNGGSETWEWIKAEPTCTPPKDDILAVGTTPLNYTQWCKRTVKDKKEMKAAVRSFSLVAGQPVEKEMQKLLQVTIKKMQLRPEVRKSKEAEGAGLLGPTFNMFPALFHMVVKLQKERRPFAILFRSFGADHEKIQQEWNAFCELRHPIFSPLIEDIGPMDGSVPGVPDRRIHSIHTLY